MASCCIAFVLVTVCTRNPWSSQLKWDPRFRTLDEYLDEWQRLYHKIDIIGDPSRWWANGNLVCNVVPPGFWNGHGSRS